MELRRGGVGSQAVGRRMDGDSRDGGGGCGGGCKDGGSEDYENLPTSASLSTHMTAGAMAGILEHSVMYPVDSVKVRREKTVDTEGAERGACARAFASRARAAWGSAPKTPLLRAVAGVGPAPQLSRRARHSFRRAPGPRGAPLCPRGCSRRRPAPLPPPRAARGAAAGGSGERPCSRRRRRRRRRSARGSDRCSSAQSYHVCPRDRRAPGVPALRGYRRRAPCPSRGERCPLVCAGRPKLPTRAQFPRELAAGKR